MHQTKVISVEGKVISWYMVQCKFSLNVTMDSFYFPADNIFYIMVKVNKEGCSQT